MADRSKADDCVTEAIATAHDRGVDMLDLGKALIEAGALLVQFERNEPGETLLDSCRWALEEKAEHDTVGKTDHEKCICGSRGVLASYPDDEEYWVYCEGECGWSGRQCKSPGNAWFNWDFVMGAAKNLVFPEEKKT